MLSSLMAAPFSPRHKFRHSPLRRTSATAWQNLPRGRSPDARTPARSPPKPRADPQDSIGRHFRLAHRHPQAHAPVPQDSSPSSASCGRLWGSGRSQSFWAPAAPPIRPPAGPSEPLGALCRSSHSRRIRRQVPRSGRSGRVHYTRRHARHLGNWEPRRDIVLRDRPQHSRRHVGVRLPSWVQRSRSAVGQDAPA